VGRCGRPEPSVGKENLGSDYARYHERKRQCVFDYFHPSFLTSNLSVAGLTRAYHSISSGIDNPLGRVQTSIYENRKRKPQISRCPQAQLISSSSGSLYLACLV